jgi:hypothetical protein
LSSADASRITFITVIAVASIALSLVSYQYSANISNRAIELSAEDVRSNAEIEAHDISQLLVNKIEGIMDNLEIIASAQSVQSQELDRAKSLFDAAQSSTRELTESYFWVDRMASWSGQTHSRMLPYMSSIEGATEPSDLTLSNPATRLRRT